MKTQAGWLDQLSIGGGDHIIAIVTEGEEADLLPPYLGRGLAAGDPCVTVACAPQAEDLKKSFERAGNTRQLESIEIHDPLEFGRVDGVFEPQTFLERTGQRMAELEAAGAKRIWHSGLMRWLGNVGASADDILLLEASINLAVEGSICSGFCIYDGRRIAGDLLVNLLRTHPKVLLDGSVVENPFYQRPEEVLERLGR